MNRSIKTLFLSLARSCGIVSCVKVASFYKLSFIVGSFSAFFSLSGLALPLAGAFSNGVLTASCASLALVALRVALHGFSWWTGFHTLAFVLPGFCAALYWASRSAYIRFALPVACMVLFVVHPVGRQAFVYSLFWLLPIGVYFYEQRCVFMTALASTLVAHAVGSVIWLYSVPMTSNQWLALIPMVAVERLCYAAGMMVLYYTVSFLSQKISRIQQVQGTAHLTTTVL